MVSFFVVFVIRAIVFICYSAVFGRAIIHLVSLLIWTRLTNDEIWLRSQLRDVEKVREQMRKQQWGKPCL